MLSNWFAVAEAFGIACSSADYIEGSEMVFPHLLFGDLAPKGSW